MKANLWVWVPGSVHPSRYHHSVKRAEPRWKISKEHLEDFAAPSKFLNIPNFKILPFQRLLMSSSWSQPLFIANHHPKLMFQKYYFYENMGGRCKTMDSKQQQKEHNHASARISMPEVKQDGTHFCTCDSSQFKASVCYTKTMPHQNSFLRYQTAIGVLY